MVLVADDGTDVSRPISVLDVAPASVWPADVRDVAAPGAIAWRHCAELGVVIVAALGLAIGAPLTTAVYALILFGVRHNYF